MTEEQKEALIEWAHKWLEPARRMAQSNPNDESAQASLALYEIALAALTAQPVKLPDCDFAAVVHMSGGADDYCYGFVDGTQNAIKAIRAAGYQVEGE